MSTEKTEIHVTSVKTTGETVENDTTALAAETEILIVQAAVKDAVDIDVESKSSGNEKPNAYTLNNENGEEEALKMTKD